jgi:hypothetical protein
LCKSGAGRPRANGYIDGDEVCEVSKDDPRWTAACHRFDVAFRRSDEIALAMHRSRALRGLAALMAYAGEQAEQGYLWPERIVDETVDDQPRDWERWVLIKAAATTRQLSAAAA